MTRTAKSVLQSGYSAPSIKLAGIEISRSAVGMMAKNFPDLAREVPVRVGALEESLELTASSSVDVVFTMAVLMHWLP